MAGVASATKAPRQRRDSLFGSNGQLGTSNHSAKSNKRRSALQTYVSERSAQIKPWTAFMRGENQEDDPVHVCVCVCVFCTVFLNLACVTRFVEQAAFLQALTNQKKFFRSQETKRLKWSNAMLIQRSKIANLPACFFTFVLDLKCWLQYL